MLLLSALSMTRESQNLTHMCVLCSVGSRGGMGRGSWLELSKRRACTPTALHLKGSLQQNMKMNERLYQRSIISYSSQNVDERYPL